MNGKEIEFKFRVDDEAALDAFADVLGRRRDELAATLQENNFFDSSDGRLRARGLSLRLRLESGRALLTIKGKGVPRTRDGALVERFEAESAAALADARAILAGSVSPLACLRASADPVVREGVAQVEAALGDARLAYLGGFENERTTLPAVELPIGGRVERLVFELDRTSFPHGRVDCEIEVEIGPETDAEGAREVLAELLQRAGIRWCPASSKLARFLEILEECR